MENKVCCFGHREIYENISEKLSSVIEELIKNKNVKIFMTGGMGEFDSKFSSAVRSFKTIYPDIKLLLIKPYFSTELNTNKDYYQISYDEIIIPDVVAGVHPKSAIQKRNRWMVENSDIVISYVHHDFGGAFQTIKYAKLLNKQIISI